ncbi:MAG TPA: isoprenylcysteine carboxylmethyltransferase family protein [Caulobacteraceae bacterium]|nr:isoprenylcysteine carboxylmethyltransferase family protein [Caulobacteraceae bacterium]
MSHPAAPGAALDASYGLWIAWLISWTLAALWSRRSEAEPSMLAQASYRLPTVIGYGLIAFAARARVTGAPLWPLSPAAGWALVVCQAAGFCFTWWARIHLGSLWSGSVTRKQDHRVIDTGPYRLVRHPIYTGLLFSTVVWAVQIAEPAALLGVAFAILAFWLKARLEERFLARELGQDAYAAYRRRTPMLVPFWPARLS